MKKLYGLLFLGVIILVMTACGGDEKGNSNKGNSGEDDELVYATTSDAPGLSPIDTNDSVSADVTEQVFETLFVQDPETMEPEPLLAESYETPDDLTWEINLREDIEFQDGTDFDAEAVKYSFEELKDPDRAAPRASLLDPITDIEVKDEYTVVLKTDEPYGPMLAALSHPNAAIVSPEADEEGDIDKEPVGTGPYEFEEWEEGDHITLTKNEDYWQDTSEIDEVTFKIVPEESTALSMLEAGEVDFLKDVSSDLISRAESMDGVELQEETGTRVSFLGFNVEKEPYSDPDFREAVAHAVNQEEYVDQVEGTATRNDSIMGPEIFGYNEDDQDATYSYDPEKAEKMLEENGYDGEEITMLAADRENYVKMAEIVQAQLEEVGLNVEIEKIEWASFLDTAREGNYEMTFLGWENSTADGSELFYPNLHSDNIDASNYSRYDDEEFDEIVEESRNTIDEDERKEKLSEANTMAIEDAPWVVMAHENVNIAHDDSIEEFELSPTAEWRAYKVTRK